MDPVRQKFAQANFIDQEEVESTDEAWEEPELEDTEFERDEDLGSRWVEPGGDEDEHFLMIHRVMMAL